MSRTVKRFYYWRPKHSFVDWPVFYGDCGFLETVSQRPLYEERVVCPKKCPAFSGIVKHQQILDLVLTLWAQFGTTYYVLHLQVYSIYRRDVYNFYIFAFISKSFLHFLDRRIRGAFYGTTRYFFYPICHKNFSHIYQINDILYCIMYTLTFLN